MTAKLLLFNTAPRLPAVETRGLSLPTVRLALLSSAVVVALLAGRVSQATPSTTPSLSAISGPVVLILYTPDVKGRIASRFQRELVLPSMVTTVTFQTFSLFP